MDTLTKTGRIFYGVGIVAFGIQQIVIKDFRPEILPPFPEWAHNYSIIPIVTGFMLIVAGLIITGIFKVERFKTKRLCLYLGFYFLALIILCHLPYLIFIFPHKLIHLGVWSQLLKELAFSGGAFVMAGSFADQSPTSNKINSFDSLLEKLIPAGRIFFCTTMVLYGWSHFLYIDFIATMVPAYFGMPVFWAYFAGTALICSGLAIAFKIFLKPVALLLATMLFLWFVLLHVPHAIADPYQGRGNLIVSAFDALLFCGTALVLSQLKQQTVFASKSGKLERKDSVLQKAS